MKKKYILFFLAFISCLIANAQEYNITDTLISSEVVVQTASLEKEDFQSMSLSYYKSKNTFDRNYSFELYNKQRRLRMWSNEVRILGYASFLGVCFGGPFLFPDASLWVLIPTEVVIAGGLMYGSTIWANSLKRKADAIRESSISLFNLSNKSTLYISHYTTEWNHNAGVGIGYRYNF